MLFGGEEGHGVGLWKAIGRDWDVFISKISSVVGIRFWKDIWCGNTPLRTFFPKDAWVYDARE